MGNKIRSSDHMIQTLRLIQSAGHESAIIAGGAIRDTYHDALVSDVDIFIQHPGMSTKEVSLTPNMPHRPFNHDEWSVYWASVMGLQDTNNTLVGDKVIWYYSQYEQPDHGDVEGHDLATDVISVWNVFKGFAMYQVIFLNADPVEYVETKFDFGICKAYTDGNKIRYTDDFMTDSLNRTITFVGEDLSERQVEYAMANHLPRIQEKYPGYTVIPPTHQEK